MTATRLPFDGQVRSGVSVCFLVPYSITQERTCVWSTSCEWNGLRVVLSGFFFFSFFFFLLLGRESVGMKADRNNGSNGKRPTFLSCTAFAGIAYGEIKVTFVKPWTTVAAEAAFCLVFSCTAVVEEARCLARSWRYKSFFLVKDWPQVEQTCSLVLLCTWAM